MNCTLGHLLKVSIAFWGVIMTYYSVMLGTQRMPNFTNSLFKVLKHSICFCLFTCISWFVVDLLRNSSNYERFVIYVEILFFLLTFIWIACFMIQESQKINDFRCHYKLSDSLMSYFHLSKDDKIRERHEIEADTLDSFCDKCFPKDKKRILETFKTRKTDSISIFYIERNRLMLDKKLIEIAFWALENNINILYLSCNRHPCEFYEQLVEKKQNQIKVNLYDVKKRIILVDAHSCHFGFNERIYRQITKKLKDEGIILITAKWTYAGIHSAIAHGYKTHFDNEKDKQPTILLYDSCYCLTDIENEKQYRILLEHIIPSERSYRNNITIFCEQWIPKHLYGFINTNFDAVVK